MSAVFAFRAMKKRAEAAEREVARLTESLAAERRATGAEACIEEVRDPLEAARAIRSELVQVHDELLAAERDRDAAEARVRELEAELKIAWEDDPKVKELEAENTQLRDELLLVLPGTKMLLDELAALRERVARAIEYLEQHGSPFRSRVGRATEALRGS